VTLRVTFTSADDWAAVYVDGASIHQGHSVPPFVWVDVLRRCGVEVLDASEVDAAYEMAEQTGGFPADDKWLTEAGQ